MKQKPTSPGIRWKIKIYKNKKKYKKIKNLIKYIKKSSGRNNTGKITSNHKGGGKKKLYRIIDFKRNIKNIKAKIKRNENDPYRKCKILLLQYTNGIKKYILNIKNINKNKSINANKKTKIKNGNNSQLKNIPINTKICCVEFTPNNGAKISRTAGGFSTIIKQEKNHTMVKLQSKKIIKLNNKCTATIGMIANSKQKLYKIGKAGTKRLLGIRPTVRGVAMNPIDHPHGGGEGKTGTKRTPVNKRGKQKKGLKTSKK